VTPDTPPLPALWQATFDDQLLDQYFADLGSAAEVISVRAKADPRRYAADGPLTLSDAHNSLKEGVARGVQIHYRYGGEEWTDTVLRGPGGYRLVRMKVPDREP
jgi:hypothetical protein